MCSPSFLALVLVKAVATEHDSATDLDQTGTFPKQPSRFDCAAADSPASDRIDMVLTPDLHPCLAQPWSKTGGKIEKNYRATREMNLGSAPEFDWVMKQLEVAEGMYCSRSSHLQSMQ